MALKQIFTLILRDAQLDACVRVVFFVYMCNIFIWLVFNNTSPSHHLMHQC